MGLEDLGDPLVHSILSKLDADDKARFACVNTRFRVFASDDCFWSLHCSEELNLSTPVDSFGSPLPSFRMAYQAWRQAFSMYSWVLVKRAKRCWDKLRDWLRINHPDVMDTLQRGVAEVDLCDLERSLGVRLPAPARVLYRICGGQELSRQELSIGKLCGLIGGYCYYDQLVDVHLLSLKEMCTQTKMYRRQRWIPKTSKYIAVATCFLSEKVFFLNCSDYQLYVCTRTLPDNGGMLPCVPEALLSSMGRSANDKGQDGLLLWLEEHGRRLHEGIIGVREDGVMKSINQFPELPPMCLTSVTNGVQVRASAVLAPELTVVHGDDMSYMFAYSIRMSLLAEGCTSHGMKYNSCQLYWRHWIIREGDTVVDDVNGEAVIGKYPLLVAGEKEFVYESCSPQGSVPGSIEGSFKFVPGRLSDPKGDEFDVEVARFPLEIPDYIF